MSSLNTEKAAKKASENLDHNVGRPKLVNVNFSTPTRVTSLPFTNNFEAVVHVDLPTRDIGPHTHRMVWHK
jgi:hypothetical protein